MPPGICFYEDPGYKQFFPLTHLRPVYAMQAGIVPLFQRVKRYFPESQVCLAARDDVAPLVASRFREQPVNIIKRETEDFLFLNGRIRDYGDIPSLVKDSRLSTRFVSANGTTIGVLFKEDSLEAIPKLATPKEYIDRFGVERADIPDFETTATVYDYPWQLVADIEREIEADFPLCRSRGAALPEESQTGGVVLVNRDDIVLDEGARIAPGAVLDASHGPIYIGANARVEPQAAIFGPCYIGPNSVVVAGKITGSSIGHTCRVGGEVEECVFQACVNKYHAGFIGHSYVGQWVNFGAMTTNSDLKNNYSNIRVSVNGELIDTGMIKVGSFIGDHTKFGIGTLLNTGINIGVCCNIFGGGLVSDKEVPSFSWGSTGAYQKYRYDKALETARRTTERRNETISEHETAILQALSENSWSEAGVVEF